MNSIGPEYQDITLLLLVQMSTRWCMKRLSRYINAKLQVFPWRFVLEILVLMDWHLISKWEGIMPGTMLLRKFRSTNNIKRKFHRWYSTHYIHFKSYASLRSYITHYIVWQMLDSVFEATDITPGLPLPCRVPMDKMICNLEQTDALNTTSKI